MSVIDIAIGGMDIRKFLNKDKIGYKLEDREEFDIVRDTLIKYGMPTKNFDSNLPRLTINENNNLSSQKEKSSYIAGSYLAKSNIINYPESKSDLIHELFHMASNVYSDNYSENNTLMGCELKNGDKVFGESLNDGITDYFTSLAVPNYMQKYPVEIFIVSYLTKIYGLDIFKEHFNESPNVFYSSFKEDKESVKNIVDFLDEFYRAYNKIYKLIDEVKKKECSEEEKNNEIIDIYKKNVEGVAFNFVNCISEFIKLMQSKELNYKEFVSDLDRLLSTGDNECMREIVSFFEYSSYQGKENIIQDIVKKIDGEKLGL